MKYIILWVAFLVSVFILIPFGINISLPEQNSIADNSNTQKKVSVYFADTGKVKTMNLNEYLVGVVSAEMPASFEYEALKAQAVAARTYTVGKIKENANSSVHKGADICTNFAHCQAYISERDACKNWGKNASNNLKKCKNAVYETGNTIMIYNKEPVKAVFHSSSSGKTENAKDVWGGSVPYLVSVDSPGEEACPSHESKVVKTIDEFKKVVSDEYEVDFSKSLIGQSEKTKAGMVKQIEIGNIKIKGTAIRTMFNLRSACFDVKADGNNIVFSVTGNGHGVGMSQYGANYLASKGFDCKQILKKYYTGVEFGEVSDIK